MNAEKIIALVLAVLVLGCGCAAKSGMDKNVLFFDDFDNNADAWVQDSDKWRIDDGEYVVSLSGYGVVARAFIKGKIFSNFMLELYTRRDKGGDNTIAFRYQDADNKYFVNLRQTDILFIKVLQGQEILLANPYYENPNGVWHKIKLLANKGRIMLYVDGELLVDYDDADTEIKEGKVMLAGWTGASGINEVRYDNVKVYQLK